MTSISNEHRHWEEQSEDGSWIDAELLREVLEAGATVLRIERQLATGRGDNFLSILHRTRVEYRVPQSEEVRVKNLIVKGLPSSSFLRVFIGEVCAFHREIEVYEDVLPRLYLFADARLGDASFERLSPGFYKTSHSNMLILDDLKAQGFVSASRRNRLDFIHSKLVVQNLARFHVLSLAFTEDHPDYISQFDDKLYCENSQDRMNQFFPPQITSIVEEIRTWGGFDTIANKLEALRENFVNKLMEVRKHTKSERNVLIHGDCWINNMLFKYSVTNQPIELRFVDFQVTHASTPGIDLNYFLFSSIQQEVHQKRYRDLLHAYCDEFNLWATKLGYGGPPITLNEVKEEINRTLFFGFVSMLTTMAIVLADPEDSPDLANVTEEQAASGEGMNLYEKVYKSATFREAFGTLLPYFDSRRVFD